MCNTIAIDVEDGLTARSDKVSKVVGTDIGKRNSQLPNQSM